MKKISVSLSVMLLLAGVSAGAAPYNYQLSPAIRDIIVAGPVGSLPGAVSTEPSHCTPGTDTDGDCVADADDNCPSTPNANQADANWDHIGDACANDWDNDTVNNDTDNCYAVANTDQADLDGDDVGDACDIDRDGDGITNEHEATLTTNPDKWDSDGDNVSDYYDCAKLDVTKAIAPDCDAVTVIDNLPDNPGGTGGNGGNPDINEPGRDDDGDGVNNGNDNCPIIFNPGQQDGDGDGIGDLCDMLPGRRSDVLFIKGGGGSSGGGCSLVR